MKLQHFNVTKSEILTLMLVNGSQSIITFVSKCTCSLLPVLLALCASGNKGRKTQSRSQRTVSPETWTTDKRPCRTKPQQVNVAHRNHHLLTPNWINVSYIYCVCLQNIMFFVSSCARLHRDRIRWPGHSLQLRTFLLFFFFSEPELCSWCFRLHPIQHVLLLFRTGGPVCPVPVTSAPPGPCPPASAPPGTAGYSADEQRQYGHGEAQWG